MIRRYLNWLKEKGYTVHDSREGAAVILVNKGINVINWLENSRYVIPESEIGE